MTKYNIYKKIEGYQNLWKTFLYYTNVSNEIDTDALLCDIKNKKEIRNREPINKQLDITDKDPLNIKYKINQLFLKYTTSYLKDCYQEESVKPTIKSWMGISSNSQINLHNHHGAFLSGVLYLQVNSGDLLLYDPRFNATRASPDCMRADFEYRLQPKQEDLIIFPSYIYHQTTISKDNLRICIPFDTYF